MTHTFKDHPDRKIKKHQRRVQGARALRYGLPHADDHSEDAQDVRQYLAEHIRRGGYVDLLLGRTSED